MNHNQLSIHLLLGIIDGAKRILGEDAYDLANKVDGLKVSSVGEIIVSGDSSRITQELIKTYESELHGHLIVDIGVRFNVSILGKK